MHNAQPLHSHSWARLGGVGSYLIPVGSLGNYLISACSLHLPSYFWGFGRPKGMFPSACEDLGMPQPLFLKWTLYGLLVGWAL
jgi:hypothetical protein